MPIGRQAPAGVNVIQLPPVRVTDGNFAILRDAAGHPVDEAYRRRRCEMLLAAYDAARPAAVIVETFPFGRRALRFELVPLLEHVAAAPQRPVVFASVRDLLQLRRNPGREQETLDAARRWFDAILVHGDRRFARIEETFTRAGELGVPVRYTGFVSEQGAPMSPATPAARSEVVVSAGGGAVGVELLASALMARTVSRFGYLTWRVLVGDSVSDGDFRRLQRAAGPGAIVERSREDFPALLERARVSVSQAGYNTVLDVVRSGARPVVVPYAEHGETEQSARADRLRELGLAVVVDGPAPSPSRLADAIDRAASQETWAAWTFDCDGVARTAEIVSDALARAALRQTEHEA
jgi:predicted glycosyltransferase